jgi:hypothetical protein
MMRRLVNLILCIFLSAYSTQAFSQPKFIVGRRAGIPTEVNAAPVVEPRAGRVALLGGVVGRFTNRIIDGFLSDEHDFKATVLQAVFLLGVIEMVSDNRACLGKSPLD